MPELEPSSEGWPVTRPQSVDEPLTDMAGSIERSSPSPTPSGKHDGGSSRSAHRMEYGLQFVVSPPTKETSSVALRRRTMTDMLARPTIAITRHMGVPAT